MNNQLPSFAATPGGTTSSKSGEGASDDKTNVMTIAKELGIEAQELADLLKKG